jgi:histidine triad (HIT) family protein
MSDCLFCKIIQRKIPSIIVYEDDRIIGFNDIAPQAPTHVLIVPKRHIPTLNDVGAEDEQLVGELVRRAAAIARERGFSETGYRTLFNTNRGAGQTVFHIHLHVIAGRAMGWPPFPA